MEESQVYQKAKMPNKAEIEELPTPSWKVKNPPFRYTVKDPASEASAREIQRIERESSSNLPSEGSLIRLFTHPDEAVAIAALDKFGEAALDHYRGSAPETERARRIVNAMLMTMYKEAEREEVLWFPRLDRTLTHMAPFTEILGRIDGIYTRPLKRWIMESATAEELADLRNNFTSRRLQHMIAVESPEVNEDLFQHALSNPREAISWTGNEHLSEEQVRRLVKHALENYEPVLQGNPAFTDSWRRILALLAAKGHLKSEDVDALVPLINNSTPVDTALIRKLLRHGNMSREQFEGVYKHALDTRAREFLELVAKHPCLNEEEALKLWKKKPQVKLGLALLENPTHKNNLKLRRLIREKNSRSLKLKDALIQTAADVAEFREIFPDYLKERPKQALDALKSGEIPKELIQALPKETFAEILTHPNRKLRVAAIQLVADQQEFLAQARKPRRD